MKDIIFVSVMIVFFIGTKWFAEWCATQIDKKH